MTDQAGGPRPATLRSALAIAWPASLAAIVTPLLGLIDIAVLARAAGTQDLAGASLAGAVFSLLYWSFGFLRMSLSGLAAQAVGKGDNAKLKAHLLQGVVLGAVIGAALFLLQGPITWIARLFLVESSQASPGAGDAMATYIQLRIIAAPAALMTTAVLGWLTGQGRTGLMMLVTIGTASINAGLSILFVLEMGYGIGGLAAATAMAETAGLLIGLGCVAFVLRRRGGVFAGWSVAKAREGVGAVLALNRDIFIRTLILDAVFLGFARFGAGFGDLTLAANHVLLNLVLTVTLLLDGPAIAAETFVGQAVGADRNRHRLFEAAWKKTAVITAGLAILLLVGLTIFGDSFLDLTIGEGTDNQAVRAEAQRFLPWAVVMPLAVATAYFLDGVYIGATRGSALRDTMIVAGTAYFMAAAIAVAVFGNHGLWAALLLFMIARGAALIAVWPGFRRILAT